MENRCLAVLCEYMQERQWLEDKYQGVLKTCGVSDSIKFAVMYVKLSKAIHWLVGCHPLAICVGGNTILDKFETQFSFQCCMQECSSLYTFSTPLCDIGMGNTGECGFILKLATEMPKIAGKCPNNFVPCCRYLIYHTSYWCKMFGKQRWIKHQYQMKPLVVLYTFVFTDELSNLIKIYCIFFFFTGYLSQQ